MANASELNSRVPSSAELLFGRVVSNRLKVDGSNNKQLIGRGNRNTPLVFLPGKAMVFSLDFLVSYSPNKQFGNAVNDPALNEIIQLCVEAPLIPGYNRTTTIRYEAEADIGALRWLPVKPLLSGELKINCPFQGAARQALLDAIKGGSSTGVNTQVPTTQARNSRMTANSTLIKSEAVLTKEMFMGRN